MIMADRAKRKTQIGAALGCDTHREVQERVSIRAPVLRELPVVPQQRREPGNIARFQRPKGRKKGLRGLRVRGRCEQVRSPDEVVPGIKSMLSRIDHLGIGFGKRRLTYFFV